MLHVQHGEEIDKVSQVTIQITLTLQLVTVGPLPICEGKERQGMAEFESSISLISFLVR
jgi:hypothetical protein